MSDYIQRGPNTRNRNHLMVEVIPVDRYEPTGWDFAAQVVSWLGVLVIVALLTVVGLLSLRGMF